MACLYVFAALLALGTASPANAQEAPAAEKAMAQIIHAALAPSSYGDWRYDWGAVSSRISGLMHWHIYGRDTAGEETLVRRGWVATDSRSLGIAAYGSDTRVTSLTFDYYTWPQFDGADVPLTAALAAEGVTATEIERRQAPEFFHTDTPVIVYRLTASGRDPGRLTLSSQCTSPNSAAARRCETSYTLDLGG